jgi:hypothetical protein
MGVPYGNGNNNPSEWKSTIVNSVTVYEPTTDGADINTQGNITASGDITSANIPAWAVTATHNFLSQSITESTPLTTAGLATPGSENYVSSNLLSDHNISLPKAGSTSHFVSPNQPIFTFTKPTLVHMIIPITTATGPLRSAGWLYIPYTKSYLNPWLPGDPLPTLNSTGHYGADDVLSGLITNLGSDYLYGRVFPAGTHNLDPTALAPLAFYLFEENSFDYQVYTNTTNIATNTGLLSATPGIATGGKALILHSSGDVGIGTTGAPDTKLHVVGDIKATGTITGNKQFYLTVNSYNANVNSLPVNLTTASKLNNSGLASLASNWTRFPSWKQNLSNDTINTDLNNGNDLLGVFQDVLGGYGVKVKAAGYYKATCQMHFYSTTANTSVAIRFAKNALVDDVQDQDTENPGPCQMSNVSANTASSACLSHVMLCAVDDVISVYTSKAGADGTVVTSPASCTLLIEFFGLDV